MTGRQIGLTVGIALVVLFAVFWIGATIWFFGDENPDRLQDREWVADAEARCAQARDELELLPQAREAVDMADRADQIEAATAVLAKMTADLAASAHKATTASWWGCGWGVGRCTSATAWPMPTPSEPAKTANSG